MPNDPSSKNKRCSSPKDLYIAKKLRERRVELGMKQSDIADGMGLTPQQFSKYEKGIDRIPAGRLFDFARILLVPISFFDADNEDGTSLLTTGNLVFSCATLQKRKVKIKSFKLKATLADLKTQKEYDLEIS